MASTSAPVSAELVRKPGRSECPAKTAGSSPAALACRLTTSATDCAVSGLNSRPYRLMRRNTGPASDCGRLQPLLDDGAEAGDLGPAVSVRVRGGISG